MNILYLSHLGGNPSSGPTYSVPKQIEAQSKLDNVFWFNAVKKDVNIWKEYPYYHDLNEFPHESIKDLPSPFNKPDIVVVELFYNMMKSPIIKELIKGVIPYVIIPRGELTKQAQNRKRFKKEIANLLVCRHYAKKAAAIQYLTEQEKQDSGDDWNRNYTIIPNGIEIPEKTKVSFSDNGIKCVSIGRIEPYQKGLDLLIEACSSIKNELTVANCSIIICGPDKENKLVKLKEAVKNTRLDLIIKFKEGIYGKEKAELLMNSDVFLIPSRFEGHPMALIEALSYGLPCIATTGSNMRKEVEVNNAGWSADNTVESLASSMLKMLNEKWCFREKSLNAIELARQYSWGRIARRTHDFYNRIVSREV